MRSPPVTSGSTSNRPAGTVTDVGCPATKLSVVSESPNSLYAGAASESLVGENRSIRWKVAIGSPERRSSTTRSRSSSTGRNSEAAVYSTCCVISSGRISYCHTAQPRSAPLKRKTNESRVAGMAPRSKRSSLPPADWAAAANGLASSRKQSQRIGLENGLLVRVVEREFQELVDVGPHVPHAGTGPVRAPQHAVSELGQAGKVLQQPRRRDPGHVEPHPPVPPQHEERLSHVQ